MSTTEEPFLPLRLRKRIDTMSGVAKADLRVQKVLTAEAKALEATLEIAPTVKGRLEQLSERILDETIGNVKQMLTLALQDVLEQRIELEIETDNPRGRLAVNFYIRRDGLREDILKGQGGSVANILSVGLRYYTLSDQKRHAVHRPFLVLDEQDCWLRPDLVPRLVKLIRQAAQRLEIQVIYISHHDPRVLGPLVDRTYRFFPQSDNSVQVERADAEPGVGDEESSGPAFGRSDLV